MIDELNERPTIGITIGDPSGIGPEIVLKALLNEKIYNICRPLVIGSANILTETLVTLKRKTILNVITDIRGSIFKYGSIDVLSIDNIETKNLRYGQVQAEAGRAAFDYIKKSVELANKRHIDAIVTAPINKEAIKAANIDFIGHTEMLAKLTNTKNPLTMFQVHNLRIFFFSRHVSLKDACNMVKKDVLVDYIIKCEGALKKLGIKRPTIAVAGLNPHNGENGLFGNEEINEVLPAVNEARLVGINVVGPISADSVFYQALQGKYNAVVSLYHDQGHIAAKTVDFEKTISLTIGLPFIRTSVTHGTAFDIAGKDLASSISMEEAIRVAVEYTKKRE